MKTPFASIQLIAAFLCCLGGFVAQAEEVEYLRDVKPLLEHKCYACHGALKQQGGLRLDTAASLIKGGDSGPTVVAGKASESLLIDVLTGGAGFRMPPDSEGAVLTTEEVSIVRRWINDGAKAPPNEEPQTDPRLWWSYLPLQTPDLPTLDDIDSADAHWARNEIDLFVAAERHQRSLPHVEEASKAVWLRRVHLDLIGLPPTRAEIQRFLGDDSPSAYETVVDELLQRPQYGERWGRHWMDVWRYSDWYGSRAINEIRYSQRHIWRWRDWIIQSLNDDRGYNEMVREMLAADEIPSADPQRLAATGYLGRSWYKFDRNVWMFESVERTGEAFLGLTLRCCRCHDHKFDPVTQEEYYRFRAFFEPHDVRTDPISASTDTEKDATLGQVPLEGVSLAYDKHLDAETFRFERGDNRYPDQTKPLAPGVPAALGGQLAIQLIQLPTTTWFPAMRKEYQRSIHARADSLVQTAEANRQSKIQAAAAAASQLEAVDSSQPEPPKPFLHDDFATSKPKVWNTIDGQWKYSNEKLSQTAVTHFATMVTQANHPADFRVVLKYRALSPGTYRSIGFSFDYQDKGNSQDVYTSTGDSRQSVQAFHRINGQQVYPQAGIVPTKLAVGAEVTISATVMGSKLAINLNGERKLDYEMPTPRRPGKFALWVHQGAAEFIELELVELAESKETLTQRLEAAQRDVEIATLELKVAKRQADSIRERLAADVAKHLGDDKEQADQRIRTAAIGELDLAILEAELQLKKAPSDDAKLKATQAMDAARAKRGTLEKNLTYTPSGEQYPTTSTGRRAALAAWITNRSNPRTARVAANHIWGRHFGRPLVTTPENFGLNGRKPSHPQLLDWLATELTANDWRMKPLHRKIVLSATYRMTSQNTLSQDDALRAKKDADNIYFWRMESRRMEAEVVRDSTLYLAGRLDTTMGGPELSEKDGAKTLRRSVYFRNTPNEKMPMLEIFDVADPNACYRRKESVVPHQSLALMNSPLAASCAKRIASNLAKELLAANKDETDAKADADDPASVPATSFLDAAFETVLQRPPTDAERRKCETFLTDHANLLQQPLTQFFNDSTRPPVPDAQARAEANLIHVLLWHNDFVTIR